WPRAGLDGCGSGSYVRGLHGRGQRAGSSLVAVMRPLGIGSLPFTPLDGRAVARELGCSRRATARKARSMALAGEDPLPFFREGGDGVNGSLLRYLSGSSAAAAPSPMWRNMRPRRDNQYPSIYASTPVPCNRWSSALSGVC